MLIRLGEGASGGLDMDGLEEASSPLQAVTMTEDHQWSGQRGELQYHSLIKMARPMAGTAVLKIRSTVGIPRIMVTLV
jgi:hypothetical protein